jgi:predicted dehydrogenase
MKKSSLQDSTSHSRRDFITQSTRTLAGAALASTLGTRAYAGEGNTLKIALVGCGGRGTGAAVNALSTAGPTRLVAMGDVFADRMKGSLNNLSQSFAKQVDVPVERQFLGMDAYQKAIDAVSPGGVVILATPPAFRPQHVAYAVSQNCHLFMEKSFAVDSPGIRRILAAGKQAEKKNLKVAGGLMSRHYLPLEQAVDQIHGGLIGDVITCWAYRMHAPVGYKQRVPGENELAHQIRNYSCFTWVNGSFLLDWLIHNLDICCWVKGAWPVSAQAQGGRQVRQQPDQLFDHYAVEYSFADGTRLFAQGRHMDNCWGFFGDVIHGAKGSGVLGEGVPKPRLFKGHNPTPANQIWNYQGPPANAYQREHDLLFDAIRNNKPYNETEHSAYAAMTGILGRMAVESGQTVTWDQALASNLELAPGLDHFTMESKPPVQPDAQGQYPVAVPGQTQVL